MTITTTAAVPATAEPLDEVTSHEILVRAARYCEDDAALALAAARRTSNQSAIDNCNAERDLFGRLFVGLISSRTAGAAV